MQLSRAVQEFIKEKERERKAKQTVDAYRSDLNRIVANSGRDTVLNFTPELVKRYFDLASEDHLSLSTLHRRTATFREFIKWGARQRLWDLMALLEAVPRIRRQETLPRPYSRDEAARLWRLPLPAEERVYRAVLFFTGLRVSAIANIIIGDIALDPPTIRTVTKGGKTVLKHMHPNLAAELASYLESHERKARPQDFLFRKKNGKKAGRRELEEICHRWGTLAGVQPCLPHRFRHTFGTELLAATGNLRLVQEGMDHKDIKSTQGYTKVHDEQLRAAMHALPAAWVAPPSAESSDT